MFLLRKDFPNADDLHNIFVFIKPKVRIPFPTGKVIEVAVMTEKLKAKSVMYVFGCRVHLHIMLNKHLCNLCMKMKRLKHFKNLELLQMP